MSCSRCTTAIRSWRVPPGCWLTPSWLQAGGKVQRQACEHAARQFMCPTARCAYLNPLTLFSLSSLFQCAPNLIFQLVHVPAEHASIALHSLFLSLMGCYPNTPHKFPQVPTPLHLAHATHFTPDVDTGQRVGLRGGPDGPHAAHSSCFRRLTRRSLLLLLGKVSAAAGAAVRRQPMQEYTLATTPQECQSSTHGTGPINLRRISWRPSLPQPNRRSVSAT